MIWHTTQKRATWMEFSSQNDPRENTLAQTQFTCICRTLMKRYSAIEREKESDLTIFCLKDIISLCESYRHQYHHHHNHNHNHLQQHSMPCSIKYLCIVKYNCLMHWAIFYFANGCKWNAAKKKLVWRRKKTSLYNIYLKPFNFKRST